MPEIPDLNVFALNLKKKFTGKKLEKITINEIRNFKGSAKDIKTLEGQKLKNVFRDGKQVHFVFEKDILAFHLMLHGEFRFFDKINEEKFTRVEMLFEGEHGVAITDWQRNAHPILNPEEKDAPDAMSAKLNAAYLSNKMATSKTIAKSFLMDQDIIRGLGNAYTDEILYESRVSPFSITKKIPPDKVKLIASSIKKVLKNAEKQILKINPAHITGELRDFLVVHNHKKKKSPGGKPIKIDKAGGRKTYYTSEQKLYK